MLPREGSDKIIQLTVNELRTLIRDEINLAIDRIKSQESRADNAVHWITPTEARKLARCGRNKIYGAMNSGALQSTVVSLGVNGMRRLIKKADLKEWVSAGMIVG